MLCIRHATAADVFISDAKIIINIQMCKILFKNRR